MLVLPSLAASKLAPFTNSFDCSLLCPTLCLRQTPTSHADCNLHHSDTPFQNDSHPILVQIHQRPSPTTNDHKLMVSNPRISSFPSTSSGPAPTRFLRRLHYVGTSISPVTFVTVRRLQNLSLPLPLYIQPTYLTLHTPKIVHCITVSLLSLARLITLQG